ncbi:MAG: type III-B CRISPR module-associated protein Cmr3 [Leptolyngbyaceae cyanobacterium HOT.MB2.61]|nr:type III-B CRISPR module-associated protein Cmr3 [Leptolyngbyaceae cyanobacterium HOT.MB2.61]
MNIFIEPSDVLLFRDGRPFSAGEGHRARSIFPPTPNTMQGVIRSKVLAERCGRYQSYRDGCAQCPEQQTCTIPEEIGKPDKQGRGSYGAMQIRGPLIAQRQPSSLKVYFPVPADVVQVKDKENPDAIPKLTYLQPLPSEQQPFGENDLPHQLLTLWTPETKPVEAATGYWSQEEFRKYLLGEPLAELVQPTQLYTRESRFGIEVDNRKQTVQEGRLYQTEFIRCEQQVGLYVELEGIRQFSADPAARVGLIAIGGENRAASYTEQLQLNWADLDQQLLEKLKRSAGFKLYLATPTIFKQGWLPQWLDPHTLEGEHSGIQVKLVATAIARYQTIGGWDVAYNRPKPTYRAVPAGSVYYFTTKADPEQIIQTFHWKNLADDSFDAQIGFGLSLVGCWNYCHLKQNTIGEAK